MNNPEIIGTLPFHKQTGVDINIKEIVIKFNKAMKNHYAFICKNNKIDFRNGYWKDDKTFCVKITSKLDSKTEYIIYLNSPQKEYFKDKTGRALLPTTLIFKTK